jgi:general secretion pathway protein G
MVKKILSMQKGFSLMEILVVLVVLGIIIGFTLPNLGAFTTNSQVRVVETDMRLIQSNLQEHYIDFPSEVLTQERIKEYLGYDLTPLSSFGPNNSDHYKLESLDPWGNNYYLIVGNNDEIFILIHSYGPNGLNEIPPGGIYDTVGDDVIVLFYPQL